MQRSLLESPRELPGFAMIRIYSIFCTFSDRRVEHHSRGMLIDKKGEKLVLTAKACIMFVLSFGFAFAREVFPPGTALIVVATCYVIDNLILSVGMARATYIKKIAVTPADVTPVMFMGISLNQLFSISIPVLAGLVWLPAAQAGIPMYLWGSVDIRYQHAAGIPHKDPRRTAPGRRGCAV